MSPTIDTDLLRKNYTLSTLVGYGKNEKRASFWKNVPAHVATASLAALQTEESEQESETGNPAAEWTTPVGKVHFSAGAVYASDAASSGTGTALGSDVDAHVATLLSEVKAAYVRNCERATDPEDLVDMLTTTSRGKVRLLTGSAVKRFLAALLGSANGAEAPKVVMLRSNAPVYQPWFGGETRAADAALLDGDNAVARTVADADGSRRTVYRPNGKTLDVAIPVANFIKACQQYYADSRSKSVDYKPVRDAAKGQMVLMPSKNGEGVVLVPCITINQMASQLARMGINNASVRGKAVIRLPDCAEAAAEGRTPTQAERDERDAYAAARAADAATLATGGKLSKSSTNIRVIEDAIIAEAVEIRDGNGVRVKTAKAVGRDNVRATL
jgi:hypothetical protein